MIETQGRAHRVSAAVAQPDDTADVSVAAVAQEIATYRSRLPELLRDHEGQFVLIKGTDIVGFFPDFSAALREGYRRFGVVPLLVQQIVASEPAVYLPNVVL
jgi:hypothetical protein